MFLGFFVIFLPTPVKAWRALTGYGPALVKLFKAFLLIFLPTLVKAWWALTGCGPGRHDMAIFVPCLGLRCGTVAQPGTTRQPNGPRRARLKRAELKAGPYRSGTAHPFGHVCLQHSQRHARYNQMPHVKEGGGGRMGAFWHLGIEDGRHVDPQTAPWGLGC